MLIYSPLTSLDGYVAGPDQTLPDPLGRGGEDLHRWMFADPMHEVDARWSDLVGGLEDEGVPFRWWWATLRYLPWIMWQIVLSNIDVFKTVWTPGRMPVEPQLVMHVSVAPTAHANVSSRR